MKDAGSMLRPISPARRIAPFSRGGTGPTVILLHGWLCDRGDLLPLGNRLATRFDVIVPDLRGHGRHPAGTSHSMADLARDVIDLAAHLAVARAILVGHSLGGAVALEISHLAPELAAGVVLIDVPWAVVAPPADVISRPLTGEAFTTRRDALMTTRRRLLPPGTIPGTATERPAAEVFRSLMAWPGPVRLAETGTPVTALFAERHRDLVPIAWLFPGVTAHVIDGAGHWIALERAAEVAEFIAEMAGADR